MENERPDTLTLANDLIEIFRRLALRRLWSGMKEARNALW
jgi:hypothetical protein